MKSDIELSFTMSDEEIEKIKKILCTGGLRHYLLKIADDEEIDVVEYKEYQKLEKENQELKKQLEEYQLQNINLRTDIMIQKKALPNKEIKEKTFYDLYDMPTYEDLLNQQKQFIEYLENKINIFEKDLKNETDEEIRDYILKKLNAYKEILSKFKEIIGDDK